MTKSIKKTYRWKELTEDGLLKEPKELGYGGESLNYWTGFDNEEDAQANLLKLAGVPHYSDDIPRDLVLVTVYNVTEDN